jgi:hypothetical protein
MGKVNTLPKEFSPDLAKKVYGGVTPRSPLRVDWNHPLSRGLFRFMYMVPGGLYDAVSGKLYKQTTADPREHKINGLAVDASGSYHFDIEEKTHSASSSQTFTWLAAKDTANAVLGMISGDTGDTGYFIWQNNTTADVTFRRFGSDTTLTISSIDHSDMVPRTWVHDVGGNEERLQANGSSVTGTFNNNAFIENGVLRGYNTTAFNYDGKFHYYIVHERALTIGEVEELQRNPFFLLKPAIDITYFVPSAGGATTKTTTLDAVLKKTQSKTTTLDAILKQVQTLTTTLDSVLQKNQLKTTTIDSVLKKTQSKTTTLDAVIEGGGTKTTTLDSILQKTQSKTTTLDGLLQKLQTKNTTLDSILKKTFELTTTLDAVLTSPGSKLITTNLDSVLKQTIEVTTTVDAILRKTFSKTTTLDAYLKARKLLTVTIDSALRGTQSATVTIDAVLSSGEVWVVQANSSDIWTVQTNNSDTWTVV